MRITVLCYLEEEGGKPDIVVPQVVRALRKGGHEVRTLGVHGDIRKLTGSLLRHKPDLVFNLTEAFGTSLFGDIGVAGVLEMMGLPFTGSGPGELYLAQDKALGKKLLAFEGIGYPKFAIFSRDASLETGGNLRMPLFVKPVRMDASIGIDAKSLVQDAVEMMKRVVMIHQKAGDDALCEEYIEGREFYVGIVGNQKPLVLPVIEMDFSGMPEGKPHFLDQKAKFDVQSKEFKGSVPIMADLPDEMRARLQKVSLDAYRALRVRDYGRVDLRLTDTGEIFVLEVNAGCYLEERDELAKAAAAVGIDYVSLINQIADLAVARHAALPKAKAKAESEGKATDKSDKADKADKVEKARATDKPEKAAAADKTDASKQPAAPAKKPVAPASL